LDILDSLDEGLVLLAFCGPGEMGHLGRMAWRLDGNTSSVKRALDFSAQGGQSCRPASVWMGVLPPGRRCWPVGEALPQPERTAPSRGRRMRWSADPVGA